jgi:molecular chaperone DnaK
MSFHKVIGIDLGTTYSAVSIWNGREVQVIETGFDRRTVPSVVGLDPQGQVIVGEPARNNLVMDPANTIIEVKREMGVYEREPRGGDDPGQPRFVRFRGKDYLPQEISAFILMELKRQAENFVGEPIHDAVITVPAYFKEPQRGATEEAAMMAKLNVRRLLNEPTAAAVCFGADKVEDQRVHTYAVYDLGGGTFDVSIIQVAPDSVSVVGTGGDARLGGGDFDELIVAYALDQICSQHRVDLRGDQNVFQRIKHEAEARKRDLSVAGAATLNLPFLTPALSANISITRVKFEELIKGLLDRSVQCLDDALDSARESNGIERDEIEQVLLVGGSTRIPCIRPMLAEHLGLDLRDIRSDISPEEVVARGAGIVAREFVPYERYIGTERTMPTAPDAVAQVSTEDSGIELLDVTSHTLGVETQEGDFVPILPRDSRIPAEAMRDHFVNPEKSTNLQVPIYQGESKVAMDNTFIGQVPIELPEARERGYYRFAITFALDQNGLLKVEVKCLNDNQIWRTDLQCNVRVGADQIARRSDELTRAMAGGAGASADPLPRPPRREEIPPPPPPVPADTPAEFKSVARRSFKLLDQLPPAERQKLLDAYLAFVEAVNTGSAAVEELGDVLTDAFYKFHRPA